MVRKTLPTILLLVAFSFCRAQSAEESSIASLREQVNSSRQDKERVSTLLELALAYVHKPGELASDLDTAIDLAGKAAAINKASIKDRRLEARTYYVLSNAFREGQKKEEGRLYIDKALPLYPSLSAPSE